MKQHFEMGKSDEKVTATPGVRAPLTVEELDQTKPDLIELEDELRARSAEYWLKLGLADEALRELEVLPEATWKSSRVLRIRVAALGMLRQTGEIGEIAIRK